MSCGGGVQVRSSHCVDSADNVLDEGKCFSLLTPVSKRECGADECPNWMTGDWTAVSERGNRDLMRWIMSLAENKTVLY